MVPKLRLGNPGREAPALHLLHQTRITWIKPSWPASFRALPPTLRLVDIAAFDLALVDIIQFLTHHYLGFNEVRVTAFSPNLHNVGMNSGKPEVPERVPKPELGTIKSPFL